MLKWTSRQANRKIGGKIGRWLDRAVDREVDIWGSSDGMADLPSVRR